MGTGILPPTIRIFGKNGKENRHYYLGFRALRFTYFRVQGLGSVLPRPCDSPYWRSYQGLYIHMSIMYILPNCYRVGEVHMENGNYSF